MKVRCTELNAAPGNGVISITLLLLLKTFPECSEINSSRGSYFVFLDKLRDTE